MSLPNPYSSPSESVAQTFKEPFWQQAWAKLSQLLTSFVKKSGDTMTGSLGITAGNNVNLFGGGILPGSTNTVLAPAYTTISSSSDYLFIASNAVWVGAAYKAVTTSSGAGLYQCNAFHKFWVSNGAVTAGTNITSWALGFTVQSDATCVSEYYHKLGSGAPAIQVKKLTGTTGSTTDATPDTADVSVSHGLTLSKIISCTVMVDATPGGVHYWIPPGYTDSAGYLFNFDITSTTVNVRNQASAGSILSCPFVVYLTYEA